MLNKVKEEKTLRVRKIIIKVKIDEYKYKDS